MNNRIVLALVLAPVLALSFAFPAAAGSAFDAAKASASRSIKAAQKRIDAVPSCAQTQGANIRDAASRAAAMTKATAPQAFEDLRVYLAGLALGGAFSGCPEDLYPHLTAAQNALSQMSAASRKGGGGGAAPEAVTTYAEDDEDDDGVESNLGAGAACGVTADDVTIDPSFVDQRGEAGIFFGIVGAEARNLAGKKISWSLLVKRKAQPWKKAKSFSIGETRVTAPAQQIGNVSISVRYSTFANKGFSPGEHVAALVGTINKTREPVFRDELPFVLPVAGGDADVEPAATAYAPSYAPAPAAAGPNAMSERAFRGLLGALQGASTDFTRVDMVKSASKKSWFTSSQLGEMLDTMGTDFSRLDAAKAVVPKLVDRENGYGLAGKFSTSFSQQEYTALL